MNASRIMVVAVMDVSTLMDLTTVNVLVDMNSAMTKGLVLVRALLHVNTILITWEIHGLPYSTWSSTCTLILSLLSIHYCHLENCKDQLAFYIPP